MCTPASTATTASNPGRGRLRWLVAGRSTLGRIEPIDECLTGTGSVFTSEALVRAALAALEPLYLGEDALEPERVSEKLHQNTFWLGRGGTLTHTISGIDVALWDILGQAVGQPVGRLLAGRYRDRVMPYASVLMDKPSPLAASARDAVGPDALLVVDAGGSDAYWQGDYKWALSTSHMLAGYGVAWDELVTEPWRLDQDGMLAIPQTPGLGIELDPDAVKRYAIGPRAGRN